MGLRHSQFVGQVLFNEMSVEDGDKLINKSDDIRIEIGWRSDTIPNGFRQSPLRLRMRFMPVSGAIFLTNVRGKACHEKSSFSFAIMRTIETHFAAPPCYEFITTSRDLPR
jgi:hypothetical protein